jgi:enediyne biosynthesis protein E4
MGATVGDVNNDGRPDVLVAEYGAARLFLNRGQGKFTEETGIAGIANTHWATAASFFDYDRDGWLDLVVGNYLDYSPNHKCYDAKGTLEYCGPQNFPGTVTRLFHNLGSKAPAGQVRFEDVTVPSGIIRASGPNLGVLCADFDGDRWPDIFLADDGKPNRLFMNRHDGTFQEEATPRGLAYNSMGATAGNMGVAVGDVDGDGMFDLFVTHLAQEQHSLWRQEPRGLFLDQTAKFGLANPAWRGTGFGTVLADFNQDGHLDLAYVNGLVHRPAIPSSLPLVEGLSPFWAPYAQRYQIFLNDGQGRFRDVTESNPAFSGRAAVGRGLACGDFDNDGALDLLATSAGGPAQLFHNVCSQRGHWLMLRIIDPALGGRDAYGAKWWCRRAGNSGGGWCNLPRVTWPATTPAFTWAWGRSTKCIPSRFFGRPVSRNGSPSKPSTAWSHCQREPAPRHEPRLALQRHFGNLERPDSESGLERSKRQDRE